MFTTSTRLTHSYSSRNNNIQLNEMLMNNKAIAVVAGVSTDGGLEGYLLREKSIASDSFIQFIDSLRESSNGRKLVIFMDNCTVHHSKKV